MRFNCFEISYFSSNHPGFEKNLEHKKEAAGKGLPLALNG